MTYRFFKSSGKIGLSLLFLFIFLPNSSYSQSPLSRTLPISAIPDYNLQISQPVEGKLNIVAVMVEFQPDTNRFTSGNGTFEPGSIPYLEVPGTNIDALPHDQGYFEAHLQFAKHYFERLSNQKLSVEYQVLPDIYRLNQKMEYYSPLGQSPDLSSLGEFSKDVWELVESDGSLSLNIDDHENTAFIIFHAGIGRDVELTGTTLDKTPQDIPSVYLNRNALRRFLDDPSFSGFLIDNGNIQVDNTLILPRTLSRSGEDATGERFVLPLSTNGLITAQIASHLGLPDLFNTETGESGIGRFGLMDGAGIFSYNGLFPPEMSAWEKIYMGWAEPFPVEYDDGLISLPAVSQTGDNPIAKVSISNSEHFLIENRHRDPEGNGVTLTIRRPDGTYAEQTFTNQDEKFVFQQSGFDDLLEPGVVVNVSNYDFSLPGGLYTGSDNLAGTVDDRELNGGILIWHIDNSVIEKSGFSGLNINPDRRAVNLQEADGAQDIGRPLSIGLFRNQSNGSAFDFWWSGNNSTVISQADSISLYQNRFGPDTTPNNQSNSGALSFFELYDFSDNLPVASVRIRRTNPFSSLYDLVDSHVIHIKSFTDQHDTYWKRYPLSLQAFPAQNNKMILIPGNNGIQFYNLSELDLLNSRINTQSLQQPFIGFDDIVFTVAENPNQTVNQLETSLFSFFDDEIREVWNFQTDPNSGFISSSQPSLLDIDGTVFQADTEKREIIQRMSNQQQSERFAGYQSKIENGTLLLEFPGGTESHSLPQSNQFQRAHTGLIAQASGEYLFYYLSDGKLSIYRPEDDYRTEITISESEFIDWPAFVDFNKNGSPDILFVDHSNHQLFAKNILGATLPHFPISAPRNTIFTGTPLIADINGNGTNEIIITGQDEFSINLYAYNERGEKIEGFPLHVGGVSDRKNQPIHPLITDKFLAAVSHDRDLKIWEFPEMQNVQWPSRYGRQSNNKVTGIIDFETTPQLEFNLLNSDETYNWPNPASAETTLRFQTSEQAEIRIKITTMSGRLIYDREFQSSGGLPEEILINTSTWASGGYYALVEATRDGITERKLVKIAIVK